VTLAGRFAATLRYGALKRAPYALPAFVIAAIVTGMVVRLAILDRTAPQLVWGSSTFLIENIQDGLVASQALDVRTNGLNAIRLEGEVTGEGREGILEARLIELLDDGGEREVRQAIFAASRTGGECCLLRFGPIADTAEKSYRLDLVGRDFDGSLRLALRGKPTRETGGLVLNGRPQQANLVLETEGAAIYTLRGSPRINLWWVMALFAVIDGAVGFIIYSLLNRGAP
jgi:hypothetical protein